MEGDEESGVEIIRYRGRRYKRYSSGHCCGDVSSSSASSRGSTQNLSSCLPPVIPKSKYSYSIEQFHHQQHTPLPPIGKALDNSKRDIVHQASEPGGALPLSSHIQDSQLSHSGLSTANTQWKNTLPPEPDPKDANVVLLKVKLQNNKTIQRRFNFVKDSLMHVILFAHYSSHIEALNLEHVMLCDNSVPKNVYSDFSSTLGETGLTSNTLLHYCHNT